MRIKLILLYTGSFFFISIVMVLINIMYMKSQVYTETELYQYSPNKIYNYSLDNLILENSLIGFSREFETFIIQNSIGIQILDNSLNLVYTNNAPSICLSSYTQEELFNLYESDETTVFIKDININNSDYVYLLFLDTEQVNRTSYTYDVNKVQKAYNVYYLIALNIITLFMLSYLYTILLSRPIYKIVKRISALKEGNYSNNEDIRGIFSHVNSNLNQLSTRLFNQNKEREEWISNLSHDIKTPLTSIIGHAELMSDPQYDISVEERVNRCNSIILKGNYINDLLNDLNLATRLGAGGYKLNTQILDLNKFIHNCIIELFPNESENIIIKTNRDVITLATDPNLLRRVVTNIVSNSFIHNESNVKVEIELKKNSDDTIEIIISDNGKGIQEKELSKIFSRYYRGTNTTSKTEGSGLGMAIAKECVLAQGGRIFAKNNSGGGLLVKVSLYDK